MNDEIFAVIINRITEVAFESNKEYKQNKDDKMISGRNSAFYEILDIIQGELESYGIELEKFGLNYDMIDKFYNR